MDETLRDELAFAAHAGATVIAPGFEVHSALEVEHGLLTINRDYGWMRAAEEVRGAGTGATRAIVETRLELYKLLRADTGDHEAARGTGDHGIARELADVRDRLRMLIAAADPALLPPGAAAWPDETWDSTPD